jgi:hypothetical protein
MAITPEAGDANRLYWESDASVAEIAARFDLSRRALYDALEPLPADIACPECGSPMEFENRLARRGGLASCPGCGNRLTADAEAGGEAVPPDTASGDLAADGRGDDRAWSAQPPDQREADLRHRAVLLGGAAIAGLAIGTVAALWARRRD